MPKIMIVEDDPTLVDLLQHLLKLEGYEVIALENFDRLVQDLHEHRPDGVLMDIQLAEINGLDLLDEIRGDEANKDTFVLATSGLDFASEAKQHGANDFIMKPYMPDELVKLLKENIKH